MHIVEKPGSQRYVGGKSKRLSTHFLSPMDINLPLTIKISAGMRIQRYFWLLNHLKIQQIHLTKCIEKV